MKYCLQVEKMSKSKGNVVSPEKGLDEFGADAMRQVLLLFTLGSDFPFKWETVKYSSLAGTGSSESIYGES